jgi:hypothetical protein
MAANVRDTHVASDEAYVPEPTHRLDRYGAGRDKASGHHAAHPSPSTPDA